MRIDRFESLRRERLTELNREPADRETLQARYGQVWDTAELTNSFEVVEFLAPFVLVRRRSDQQLGSMEFQNQPRFFFNFESDSRHIYRLDIDGPLFREQRRLLFKLADYARRGVPMPQLPQHAELLDGLLELTDSIADQAYDKYGIECLCAQQNERPEPNSPDGPDVSLPHSNAGQPGSTARLYVDVRYDRKITDDESLAIALDRLLETALSTPGILDDYANPEIGDFFVASDKRNLWQPT